MKTFVITGPESAGKSSLIAALKQPLQAAVVNEYVREYIEQEQRDTTLSDVDIIAKEQLRREHDARSGDHNLVLLDTHLLSNILWSQTLFGSSPEWIEQALLEQSYTHIFLLHPEGIEWIADGQRCQPNYADRLKFFQQLEQWLKLHKQPYTVVSGSWQHRYDNILEKIDAFSMNI